MRYYVLLLAIILVGCKQQDKFSSGTFRTIISGINTEKPVDMELTSDGGSVIFATTNTFPSNMVVVKLDQEGEEIWRKELGGDYADIAGAIAVREDGGMFVTGTKSFGYLSAYNADSTQAYVASINKMGVLEWEKSYAATTIMATNFKLGTTGTDIAVKSDGGVAVLGTCDSAALEKDLFVFLLDASGNRSNSSDFVGGANYVDDVPMQLSITADGKYNVLELLTIGGDYTVRMSTLVASAGIILNFSAESYFPDDSVEACRMAENSQGFLVAGTQVFSEKKSLFWLGPASEFSSFGETQQENSSANSNCSSVISSADGGFLLVGTTEDNAALASPGKSEVFVMKLDAQGEKEWVKYLHSDYDDKAWVVRELNSGYLVCSTSHPTHPGLTNAVVVTKLQ